MVNRKLKTFCHEFAEKLDEKKEKRSKKRKMKRKSIDLTEKSSLFQIEKQQIWEGKKKSYAPF